MIMTHADINFYSPSDKASFELDLDEDSADPNPSLFIRHLHDGGSMVNGRHFLTIEQLRTLRDLLNEKLPQTVNYHHEAKQLTDSTK